MMKLYSYVVDCGRMGIVEGLFVSFDEELKKIYGKTIYFGEILGKHSQIDITFEEGDFVVKSDDQEFIEKLVGIIGSTTISGYNPLEYYDPDLCDEDDDSYDDEYIEEEYLNE